MVLVYLLSACVYLGENREVTCVQYCGSTGKIWTNGLSGIHVCFFFFSTFFLTAEASIRFSDRVAMPKLHNPRTNTAPLKETGLHNISLWDTFFTFFHQGNEHIPTSHNGIQTFRVTKFRSSMARELLPLSAQGAVVCTVINGR